MEEEKVSSLTAEEAKAAGNEAFKQNNFQAAVKLYSESLGKFISPSDLQEQEAVLSNRAASYTMLNKFKEAASDCLRALEINP